MRMPVTPPVTPEEREAQLRRMRAWTKMPVTPPVTPPVTTKKERKKRKKNDTDDDDFAAIAEHERRMKEVRWESMNETSRL